MENCILRCGAYGEWISKASFIHISGIFLCLANRGITRFVPMCWSGFVPCQRGVYRGSLLSEVHVDAEREKKYRSRHDLFVRSDCKCTTITPVWSKMQSLYSRHFYLNLPMSYNRNNGLETLNSSPDMHKNDWLIKTSFGDIKSCYSSRNEFKTCPEIEFNM